MKNDITVTKIINTYFQINTNWKRDICKSRHFDAIVFFVDGEIEYIFANKTVVAKKGDFLFLPGNLPYNGKSKANSNSYYVIDFICENENDFEMFGAPCSFPASDYQQALTRLKSVLHLWNAQTITTTLGIKEQIYAILREFLGKEVLDNTVTNNNQILKYIEDEISVVDLSVKKICKTLCVSDSQLRRTTHKLMGMSPNEYIHHLRLNKSKILLASTNKTIKEISCECGFASPYYFSRLFSQKIGMSPSAYRAYISDSM